MVATNLLTVLMCLTFFRDQAPQLRVSRSTLFIEAIFFTACYGPRFQVVGSAFLVGSAAATLFGIWLLNVADLEQSAKPGNTASSERHGKRAPQCPQ